MLQDLATCEANYDRFIEQVTQSREVWGLRNPEGGWAQCPSSEFGEADVIVFWSEKAYAGRHAVNEWSEYSPIPINLMEFIGTWLKGMQQDGSLVGPNWDANLCGLEVEPVHLAQRLLDVESQHPARGILKGIDTTIEREEDRL